MHRFYCPLENITNDEILISDPEEIHHLRDVLRLKVQDEIAVFDGKGNEYLGRIKEVVKNQVRIWQLSQTKKIPDSKIKITLACALPKKAKFDYIVEKVTELGVDRIIPLITERTIVRLDAKRSETKINHWKKIALNASKQANRNTIPEINPPANFSELIEYAKGYDLCLFFCVCAKRNKIDSMLKDFKNGKILICIGPEGDFSEKEIELARQTKFKFATLGDTILKVDTAAISSIAIIQNLLS